jgi:HEAT repeat protein
VRANAADALGDLGKREAVTPLIEAFWSGRGLERSAANALAVIGDTSAVPALERAIDEMENFPYFTVGNALHSLGSGRAEECFYMGVNSDNVYTRAACVEALGRIDSENARSSVRKALEDSEDRVRRAAILALMEAPAPSNAEAVKDALNDTDFEVRLYAKEALKRIEALAGMGENK